MSFLTGSQPKATSTTQPTILPQQQSLLSSLQSLLQGGQQPAGVQAYTGQFAAPTSGLQDVSLQGLENQAAGINGTQPYNPQGILDALTKALHYGGPAPVSAPNVTAPTVNAPQIDAMQAFRQGVVEPVTDDFLSRTLPAIAGKYGAGAGGAFSSDALHAREQAGVDTTRALAQAGSQYSLAAAGANQNATLAANTTNANLGYNASAANAGNALTAGNINTNANLSTEDALLKALGIAPSTAAAPATIAGASIQDLIATLGGGAVPQQTAQTQLTGQYSDFLNQISQGNTRLSDFIAGFSPNTQQTTTVANQGSTGLLSGLLTGLAGNTGIGNAVGPALMAFLSDKRAKEDLVQVGEVDGLPVYTFRYKGDPDKVTRIGFTAQDVEKHTPDAVGKSLGGLKTVDYGTVFTNILKKAA